MPSWLTRSKAARPPVERSHTKTIMRQLPNQTALEREPLKQKRGVVPLKSPDSASLPTAHRHAILVRFAFDTFPAPKHGFGSQ